MLINKASIIKTQELVKQHFLPVTVLLFIAGFFLAPTSKALNNFYYALVLTPALLCLKKEDYRWVFDFRLLRYLLVFAGYLCLTLLWSESNPEDKFFKHLVYGIYVLGFVITIAMVAKYRQHWLALLADGLIGITAIHVLVAGWSWYAVHPLTTRFAGMGRLDHSVQLAGVYAAVAAICFIKYLQSCHRLSTLYLLAALIDLVGILLTASRGPLLALLMVVVGASLLIRNRRAWLLLIFTSISSFICLAVVPNLLHLLLRGASYRPEIWAKGWEKICEAWFFGHGIAASSELLISNNLKMLHYHNVFLNTWLYGGLVGVLLLAALILATVRQGLKKPATLAWLGAFSAGLLCLLTDGNRLLISPSEIWLYFWLPFAMIMVHQRAPDTLQSI
jgi:O-antigen ligase